MRLLALFFTLDSPGRTSRSTATYPTLAAVYFNFGFLGFHLIFIAPLTGTVRVPPPDNLIFR